MDDSDCSSEHGVTTSCSRAFVRNRLKRRRSSGEGDFKETRKTKLNGSAAKRFFQKIKQKFTSRKLRRNLKKVEVAPLLREDSLSGSDGAGPVLDFQEIKKKKSKRAKKSSKDNLVPFQGTDTRPLLDEDAESDNESSSESENEWEEKEEEINTDGSGMLWQLSKDSAEIEVMSDKKKKQNEARRLRRQKKKVLFFSLMS